MDPGEPGANDAQIVVRSFGLAASDSKTQNLRGQARGASDEQLSSVYSPAVRIHLGSQDTLGWRRRRGRRDSEATVKSHFPWGSNYFALRK